MQDLTTAAQALLDYIEFGDVYDTVDDNGDGQVDYSQSQGLKNRIEDLQKAIKNVTPSELERAIHMAEDVKANEQTVNQLMISCFHTPIE